MADKHYEAHVKSVEADNCSNSMSCYSSHPSYSKDAINHSFSGNSKEASKHHKSASDFHRTMSSTFNGKRGKKFVELSKQHDKAAKLHKAASEAHASLVDGSQHSELKFHPHKSFHVWKRQAEHMGLTVKERAHPSGEGTHHVATDAEGNHHGHFDQKAGKGELADSKRFSEVTQFSEAEARCTPYAPRLGPAVLMRSEPKKEEVKK